MRKHFLLLTLIFSTAIFANDEREEIDESIIIAKVPKKEKIYPTKLPSIYYHVMTYNYNDTVIKATGNESPISNKHGAPTQNLHTFGFDVPIYKEYISFGIELGITSGIRPFTSLASDSTVALAAKYPFSVGRIGDVALTTSAGLGLSMFWAGKSGKGSMMTDSEGNVYGKGIGLRPGQVGYFDFGVEYFPTQWFGIIAKVQTRNYDYGQSRIIKKEDNFNFLYVNPFNFQVKNAFVLGIRTMF